LHHGSPGPANHLPGGFEVTDNIDARSIPDIAFPGGFSVFRALFSIFRFFFFSGFLYFLCCFLNILMRISGSASIMMYRQAV
jgi:hypothetical protein